MNVLYGLAMNLPLAMADYEKAARQAQMVGVLSGIFGLILTVVMIISMWKLFAKAGEPGWAAIVPFYNLFVMYKISWGKGILFLLMLVPIVNAFIGLVTIYKLGKNFGKGIGFVIGMILLPIVFMPLLAFSGAEFLGIYDSKTGGYMPIGAVPFPQYGQPPYQAGYPGQPQQRPMPPQGYQGQPQPRPMPPQGYQGQPQPRPMPPQGGYQGQPMPPQPGQQMPYQGNPQQRPPQ
ncbi:hypothetical protein EII17_09920 [Clostridiales bacterium COT073_COT-073]|nr:hypothetical protein EII17_09920 [Clostridiales bacterium COT073_COT-073]